MNKVIGAHNTLTAYPAKGAISKLLAPFAKCQNKRLEELAKAGVTCYDLRMWKDDYGYWCYGHGLAEYDLNHRTPEELVATIWSFHNTYHPNEELYIRLMVERTGDGDAYAAFIDSCKCLQQNFPKIKFIDARDRDTWAILYKFGMVDDSIIHEYHASVSSSIILKYFPYLWHKVYGKKYELQEGINLIDFI